MEPADQHLDPLVASTYDERVAERFAPDLLASTVGVLTDLADGGRAVEFAIGTGRVALPLAANGVEVHGIDLSEPMVAELRAKAGGADLPVTIGDMTEVQLGDGFALAYLVFNTIGNLTTQAAQTACFRNAARHLRPGGRFVIEVGVPKLASLPPGATTRVFGHRPDYIGFDEYDDLVNQRFWSHHWHDEGGQIARVSGRFRWVWPSELDLMAQLAGMQLEHRWADWNRSPFTGDSPSHVSVWRTPA